MFVLIFSYCNIDHLLNVTRSLFIQGMAVTKLFRTCGQTYLYYVLPIVTVIFYLCKKGNKICLN